PSVSTRTPAAAPIAPAAEEQTEVATGRRWSGCGRSTVGLMFDERNERVLAISPQRSVIFPSPGAPLKMSLMFVEHPPNIAMLEEVYQNHESIGFVATRQPGSAVRG